MANILMITFDVSDRAALDVYDVIVSFGHTVTIISQSDALADNSLLNGYDLIVCPRLTCTQNSASMLLAKLNSGTPVISGTYSDVPVDGYMESIYNDNVLETALGLTSTIKANEGYGTSINLPISFNFPNGSNAGKENTDIIVSGAAFQYSYGNINYSEAWTLDGLRQVLMINEVGNAKHIAYGAFYGRTTFTDFGKYIIKKLITLAISEEPVGLIVSGKVTLEDQPHTSKVVVTSANETPAVLGYGQSDISGDYSVNVGEYNGPVLIHTMQDYGLPWSASTAKVIGDVVHPTTPNGYIYKATQAGNTGQAEPIWTAEQNVSINDGSVIYQSERLLKPEIEGYVTPTPIA